ncbi:RNA-directed DNA polymerase [Maricaulis sp.]|uniref:RNA-directed DNA polymerase n=1 Tax=Maricaulis sp. TaxID=1486257 RepID=UPI003296C743
MRTRFSLINSGLYPETLPPCFVSKDAKRAFHGIVGSLDDKKFHDRRTEYVRYSGTKHDGSRRFFGTPNIISYFYVSSFIWKNWKIFQKNFSASTYSIGRPKLMEDGAPRAVKVPSLSELSKHASKNLRYAPFVLKADIAQCFPSLYTHSIAWAAHGIEAAKKDISKDSEANKFNSLDFFVRNGQRGNTRGVLVGPDAFRIVAEFVLSRIDSDLQDAVGDKIVGAVRHVDDYYIGLKSEHDAQSVLSRLREVLATYELNLNDHKTKIVSSLEPINDLWAQRLREHIKPERLGDALRVYIGEHNSHSYIERAVSEAVSYAQSTGSDSPLKILLRSFDEAKLYNSEDWIHAEPYIQRIVQKHPHAIDYACLLVAKRKSLDLEIDTAGWLSVSEIIISRSLALEHHHEAIWMVWLLIVCEIAIPQPLAEELAKSRDGHMRALLAQAYVDGRIPRKPKLNLGNKLSTVSSDWLANLVARSQGFSKANFSFSYSDEFEHLSKRGLRLVDFDDHIETVKQGNRKAISRIRYGYDDEGEGDDGDGFDEYDFEDEEMPL